MDDGIYVIEADREWLVVDGDSRIRHKAPEVDLDHLIRVYEGRLKFKGFSPDPNPFLQLISRRLHAWDVIPSYATPSASVRFRARPEGVYRIFDDGSEQRIPDAGPTCEHGVSVLLRATCPWCRARRP